MTEPILAAATRLADVLDRENTALRDADYAAATAMVAEKTAAIAGLTAAGADLPAGITLPLSLRAIAERLRDLMAENRRLLEIAMIAQARVVAVIAQATRRDQARRAPLYGRSGSTMQGRPSAIAISARV